MPPKTRSRIFDFLQQTFIFHLQEYIMKRQICESPLSFGEFVLLYNAKLAGWINKLLFLPMDILLNGACAALYLPLYSTATNRQAQRMKSV